jgi:membrane protein YdbS with pleckstrin-like domain
MAAQPPSSQTYPLERRKIWKKFTVAMIAWTLFFGIMLLIIGLVAGYLVPALWIVFWVIFAIYILIIPTEIWYQTEYYKRYYYDIQADFLFIKKGVIMPHQTMLPWEKLQDVYMDQDLFDRIFNLWDVHVSTATFMSGHEAHIDGVNHDNAEKLRELILQKIRKRG